MFLPSNYAQDYAGITGPNLVIKVKVYKIMQTVGYISLSIFCSKILDFLWMLKIS